MANRVKINHQIRAVELRVIDQDNNNLGVLSLSDALNKAQGAGLDLIEISPMANPPVAKIADYGKFQYEENKKYKKARTKVHTTEVKSIQVKIGTGEHDLELKAKKASEWLREGDRVKVDLFLSGRAKYLDEKFLKGRLDRVLHFITEPYKITDGPKRGPKGFTLYLEKSK